MKNISKKKLVRIIPGVIILSGFIFLTYHLFDAELLWENMLTLLQHPYFIAAAFVMYFLSFWFKALAWKQYINGKARISTCLLGIIYSLLINHVLPIKIGDLVRMKILSDRDGSVTKEEAIHSVIVLRLLDLICLVVIAFLGLVTLRADFSIPFWAISIGVLAFAVFLFTFFTFFPTFTKRHLSLLSQAFLGKRGLMIISLTFLSWMLEAGILYFTALVLIGDMSYLESVFANSITVAGQVFQITPGGIANYESFLIFAVSLLGVSYKAGYTIAVLTHAMKFMFSYASGAVAFMIYPISWKTVTESGKRRKEK
jgi:glycosyltransferase AglD